MSVEQRPLTDDVDVASARRRSQTLGEVAREFVRHPSPWLLGATLVVAVAIRVTVGGWHWTDGILALVMVAGFPLYEWVIHVVVLHWRPKRIAGVKVDSLLASKHRQHHANPRDLPLVFIPWQVLVTGIPLVAGTCLALLLVTPLGMTYLCVYMALGLGYEWTHFLIHTDYRPRTPVYRAVWNNHRLHHFKNEHYWFTVTTSGTADRLLGTCPDPTTVERSATARRLHGQVD